MVHSYFQIITLLQLLDAEAAYRASVVEANETHHQLEALKVNILKQMKDLIVETDNVLKTATAAYFQLQHSINLPTPAQVTSHCMTKTKTLYCSTEERD